MADAPDSQKLKPDGRRPRFPRTLISFSLGLLGGYALWALSPQITGEAEPWDAAEYTYSIAIVTIAAIAALLRPRFPQAIVPAVLIGQLLFIHFSLDPADWILPPWVSVVIFSSLQAMGGVLIGNILGVALGWLGIGRAR